VEGVGGQGHTLRTVLLLLPAPPTTVTHQEAGLALAACSDLVGLQADRHLRACGSVRVMRALMGSGGHCVRQAATACGPQRPVGEGEHTHLDKERHNIDECNWE